VSLPALRRVRWAVRATLTLGVAASVAANILHARPNPISQAIAAWPPLALLLTVELISRVPMHRRLLAAARLGATAGIAGIAAWVSYWHMAGVAAKYGESTSSAYLLPLSVDGLIIVGSVSLVELAGRIRDVEAAVATQRQAAERQALAERQAETAAQQAVATAERQAIALAERQVIALAERQAIALAERQAMALAERQAAERQAGVPAEQLPERPGVLAEQFAAFAGAPGPVGPAPVPAAADAPPATANGHRPAAKAVAKTPAKAGSRRPASKATPTKSGSRTTPPRQRRPVAETAALAEAIEATHPEISRSELARQLGISVGRLASVRRATRELERAA
jgi:hypothetical protein